MPIGRRSSAACAAIRYWLPGCKPIQGYVFPAVGTASNWQRAPSSASRSRSAALQLLPAVWSRRLDSRSLSPAASLISFRGLRLLPTPISRVLDSPKPGLRPFALSPAQFATAGLSLTGSWSRAHSWTGYARSRASALGRRNTWRCARWANPTPSPPATSLFCAPSAFAATANWSAAPKPGAPGEPMRPCICGAWPAAEFPVASLFLPRPESCLSTTAIPNSRLRSPASFALLQLLKRALSSRPRTKNPAQRETEEEWRDPEDVLTTLQMQGVLPRNYPRSTFLTPTTPRIQTQSL